MNGKNVRESATEKRYTVLNDDLNLRGVLYGGRFVAIIDSLAARVAREHSGKVCVTASMDSINFFCPVYVDETLLIKIAVNRVWNTSMEVGVKVIIKRGKTFVHVASAYLTFVAITENGNPTKVIPVVPQSQHEKRRYEKAENRRQIRLASRA